MQHRRISSCRPIANIDCQHLAYAQCIGAISMRHMNERIGKCNMHKFIYLNLHDNVLHINDRFNLMHEYVGVHNCVFRNNIIRGQKATTSDEVFTCCSSLTIWYASTASEQFSMRSFRNCSLDYSFCLRHRCSLDFNFTFILVPRLFHSFTFMFDLIQFVSIKFSRI